MSMSFSRMEISVPENHRKKCRELFWRIKTRWTGVAGLMLLKSRAAAR